MGLSRETMESMNCDCTFKPGRDEPYIACGHNSDGINRLTPVECLDRRMSLQGSLPEPTAGALPPTHHSPHSHRPPTAS
ncbi:hypothetical protein BDZ89DRAFT_514017 [Hymenopellis radicata]|nr:hypothetical protein BDZ89DRAFT_514017 [Hymenopellis radicata]